MFNLTAKVPKGKTVYVAFSGGVDSLGIALLYKNMKFDVHLLHFNHGCSVSNDIESGCRLLANELDLPLTIGYNDSLPKKGQSVEDAWRRARYRFLYSAVPDGGYLLSGHHLDDAVETWIWSSMHGNGKIIEPLQHIEYNGKTIYLTRPFLMTEKEKIVDMVNYRGHVPVPDECNKDNGLVRNYIRNVMMEHVEFVNPGIKKVIRKKYLNLNKPN